MARKNILQIQYVVEKDEELVYEDKKTIISKDKGFFEANNKMKKNKFVCGFVFYVNGQVDEVFLYGYKRSYIEALRHPNFVCYDPEIYTGKWPYVAVLQTRHVIALDDNINILMRY